MFTIEFNNTNGIKPGTMTFETAEMATFYTYAYFESVTKIKDEVLGTTYTAEEFLGKFLK